MPDRPKAQSMAAGNAAVTANTLEFADVERAEAGFVLVSEWTVAAPEAQRPAADAAIDAWEHVPWPPGLLSHTCLIGTDGETVLHYSQWTSNDACREFVGTDRPAWARAVDDAEAGIDHRGVVGYELYRSRVADRSAPVPGCIVVVTREFDGPDLARARKLVDVMFELPDGVPTPGLISAHFHISTYGARVLNYALWASEDAHRAAFENPPSKVEQSAEWQDVHSWPGLTSTAFKRYQPYRCIAAPPPA